MTGPRQRQDTVTTHGERRHGITTRTRQSVSPGSASMRMDHAGEAAVELKTFGLDSFMLSNESPQQPFSSSSSSSPGCPRPACTRTPNRKTQGWDYCCKEKPTSTPKLFRCEVCDRSYKSAWSLAKHEHESPMHTDDNNDNRNTFKQLSAGYEQSQELSSELSSAVVVTEEAQKIRVPYPWSTVPQKQQDELLKQLNERCHVTSQLLQYGYRIAEVSQTDYKNQSTCRRCGASRAVELDAIKASPPPAFNGTKYRAVALDCEMVGLVTYDDNNGHGHGRHHLPYKETNELVHLSAVDMLTGKILINALVMPPRISKEKGRIHWRKRVTGLDARKLEKARAKAKARRGDGSSKEIILPSWQAARKTLWSYIDAATILVGHAVHHDLAVLRMVHTRVVDSGILAAEALRASLYATSTVAGGGGGSAEDNDDSGATTTITTTNIPFNQQYSLKKLCETLLGIRIQRERQPHDSLEDTYATREVVMALVKVDSSSSSCSTSDSSLGYREVREWAREQVEVLKRERCEREGNVRKKQMTGKMEDLRMLN
ncbi:hypothetical protein KEM54_000745 [Ascosphaera aggregata]|nr:hypothetical protein KEM54_000745 [Ascosphaera aggregata]